MIDLISKKEETETLGFSIIDAVYAPEEISKMIAIIEKADASRDTFRKSKGLFAIRQFLREIPEISRKIFNDRLSEVIQTVFGNGFFVVKSIYFDKPETLNWYVSYHQDLTISVDRKLALDAQPELHNQQQKKTRYPY